MRMARWLMYPRAKDTSWWEGRLTFGANLVVGEEAHLWGELTDSVSLDSMLWPGVAAAAEVMWSAPGKKPDESTTRRLADMRERGL